MYQTQCQTLNVKSKKKRMFRNKAVAIVSLLLIGCFYVKKKKKYGKVVIHATAWYWVN